MNSVLSIISFYGPQCSRPIASSAEPFELGSRSNDGSEVLTTNAQSHFGVCSRKNKPPRGFENLSDLADLELIQQNSSAI